MSDFSIIGKTTAMVDAASKKTGAGQYTDALLAPGMLIGKDAPNTYGILPIGHDETALAVDKVRYVGDNVACVAAISEAIAEQALELIEVEYEPLPAYFDPEDSMKAERDFIHLARPHNIEKEYHHVFGDPDKGFEQADYVAEARYL